MRDLHAQHFRPTRQIVGRLLSSLALGALPVALLVGFFCLAWWNPLILLVPALGAVGLGLFAIGEMMKECWKGKGRK